MKFTFAQITNSNFLLPKDINTYFLVGTDEGQIEVALKKILSSFQRQTRSLLTRYSYPEIKDNLSVFYDDLKSLQLFGDAKVIVIDGLTDSSCTKEFLSILENRNDRHLIILKAFEVKKTSKFFKAIEKLTDTAVISCYKQDPYQISQHIATALNTACVKYDREIPSYLASLLQPNSMLIDKEIEKLIAYADGNAITKEGIDQLIVDSADSSIFDLCHSIVTGNKNLFSSQVKRMIQDDISHIMIIRVMQNYFLRAYKIKAQLEVGENLEKVFSSCKPPVFFKDRDKLKVALSKMTQKLSKSILRFLLNLEIECKSTGAVPDLLLERGMLLLFQKFNRQGKRIDA